MPEMDFSAVWLTLKLATLTTAILLVLGTQITPSHAIGLNLSLYRMNPARTAQMGMVYPRMAARPEESIPIPRMIIVFQTSTFGMDNLISDRR